MISNENLQKIKEQFIHTHWRPLLEQHWGPPCKQNWHPQQDLGGFFQALLLLLLLLLLLSV